MKKKKWTGKQDPRVASAFVKFDEVDAMFEGLSRARALGDLDLCVIKMAAAIETTLHHLMAARMRVPFVLSPNDLSLRPLANLAFAGTDWTEHEGILELLSGARNVAAHSFDTGERDRRIAQLAAKISITPPATDAERIQVVYSAGYHVLGEIQLRIQETITGEVPKWRRHFEKLRSGTLDRGEAREIIERAMLEVIEDLRQFLDSAGSSDASPAGSR